MSIRNLAFLTASLVALAPLPALALALEGSTQPSSEASAEASMARFQATYVWQRKPAFGAAYTGTNSLLPQEEKRSYTLSGTAFLGMRTWQGGELYFNPELISSEALSDLHGLGGMSNGENQKGGGPNPTLYLARLFVRHTWGFGGGSEPVESAPNQMAGAADKHRLVLTAGKLSVLDVFDSGGFAHDPRTQFLNWALLTHGAFDFAADQRGYTIGAALEYYHDEWVLRAGRFEQPLESNGLPLDGRISAHYGDQVELEHDHEVAGQPGKLRLLAFRNKARMGSFHDALDTWSAGGRMGVPSVAYVRKERVKVGFGIGAEQNVTADTGLFARASANDGGEETYAFTEIERSLSGGVTIRGTSWGRSEDCVGLAYVRNGLSAAHRQYLANGGLGAFIGDGNIRYRPEAIGEAYYSLAVTKNSWLSVDFQRVKNPAYNADRGPARFVAVRMHTEF